MVQTSVWIGLFSVPLDKLFRFGYVRERDLRLFSLFAIGLGAIIVQAILDRWGLEDSGAQAGTLLCAAILKLFVSISWLLLPREKEKE